MLLRNKILLVYLLVLAMGLAISLSTLLSGQRVSSLTTELLDHDLPLLQHMQGLYFGMVEHERLLYEYYATTDADTIMPKVEAVDAAIDDHLQALATGLHDQAAYQRLQSANQDLRLLTERLDVVLSSNRVDWDLARELLVQISDSRRRVLPDLERLVAEFRAEADMAGSEARYQTQLSTALVVSFSALVLVIAAFVGYYVNRYLSDSAARRRLAMMAERHPSPVMRFDWYGELQYSNPASYQLMKQLDNHSMRPESLLPDDFHQRLLDAQVEGGSLVEWQQPFHQHWLQYSLSLLPDLASCHLYITDITEEVSARNELRYQAYHDELTGLRNRRYFFEQLQQHADASDEKPLALMLLQLDRYDSLTSSLGQGVADALLQNVATRLKDFLRHYSEHDLQHTLYRMEAAKFVVLLDSLPEPEFADHLSKALVESIQQPVCIDSNEFFLTVSVGLSFFPEHGLRPETLFANADAALGRARSDGGDGVVHYCDSIHAREQTWVAIERGLREAIEKQQLFLMYQPKISAHQHRITGVEALIRWRREDGSLVSPAEFIPVAERSGLIVTIGEWVLHEAFRQYETWSQQQPLSIAINLSARQFRHPGLLPMLSECLHYYAINPNDIELEITESLLMQDMEKAIALMHELKALGFRLAIDDFGTGYSSLSYLKRFPIDRLKIDRAFVKDIQNNEQDRTLVKAIIDLAHNLDLGVVTEGVETADQLALVEQFGGDDIQGFFFSKPLTQEEIQRQYFN
ncbi:hypothetical protein CHH28_13535 [Bacterioplanes sanyensis]|uniref:GGDEF-domain containing protein n=1 Tax=Bacterioplanes sanyensis TaxID=1249553 RepID=A0A222FMM5_9GAMM|nr:bifunctional diguanylate cyclase/phosphodiesterase [Bacterioplanes sanyensis]ASP39631.1 hypothetical protein CHH28_13535 [Bacterioplanes sanyensis]